jgi:hypothetical protein
LFALNETYFLTDKRALPTIARFALQPEQYGERLRAVLACAGGNALHLEASVAAVRQLWRETCGLAGDLYAGGVGWKSEQDNPATTSR